MGLLRGHETVAQAMADTELAAFVRTLMIEDIAPSLRAPAGMDIAGYIEAVLRRFRNPAIRHLLSQIAWDGSQKLPFRLLATIEDALAAGRPVDRLARPIAAWMRFVVERGKAGVAIVDPLAVDFAALGAAATSEARADVARFLTLAAVFPQSLAASAGFRAAAEAAYAR